MKLEYRIGIKRTTREKTTARTFARQFLDIPLEIHFHQSEIVSSAQIYPETWARKWYNKLVQLKNILFSLVLYGYQRIPIFPYQTLNIKTFLSTWLLFMQ